MSQKRRQTKNSYLLSAQTYPLFSLIESEGNECLSEADTRRAHSPHTRHTWLGMSS